MRPGYTWGCVSAAAEFPGMDGAGALVLGDTLYLLGGWNPNNKQSFPDPPPGPFWEHRLAYHCSSRCFASADGGETWAVVCEQAPWCGRHTAGYAVFADRLWVIGGDCLQGFYHIDVWSSADGANWELECDAVPWGPRCLHTALAFDGYLWVVGGQTLPQFAPAPERAFSDVWRSRDGRHWELVADGLSWGPRASIVGSAVKGGRMWLLGGGIYGTPASPGSTFFNDVWSSADGVDWRCECEEAPWAPRRYHSVAVFDRKLWVVAGCNFGGADAAAQRGPIEDPRPISGGAWIATAEQSVGLGVNTRTQRPDLNRCDVWWSEDGATWHEVPATPWVPRHAACLFPLEGRMIMASGSNGDDSTEFPMFPDVWALARATSRL
jgi:hypothetical protein